MTVGIPPNATIVHRPHGFVDLVECRADDLMVVNAARTSYATRSEWCDCDTLSDRHLNERDAGLVKFLMKNKHGTPFEQNFFQFHIRAPIFVFREWHRHRIGISINEESGRYVQLQPDFYVPDHEHVRVQVGKPGHYTYEPSEPDHAATVRDAMRRNYERAYADYEWLLSQRVAKEIARSVLPVGIYSQMMWTCNARSLMAFLSLRNHTRALREIRDYAEVMERYFVEQMPVTAQAFIENDRVAP